MLSNSEKLAKLRQYFASGSTRSYQFRRQQLEKLKQAIIKYLLKMASFWWKLIPL